MSGDHPPRLPAPDRPWMMRTYAGHSTAKASNELYRRNLEKGQTGLSVAFDLPTQTGYDPDDELARGEVGKVGVPISHRGDMAALMAGIPLAEMNTSMTINATAAWLLALYIVVAEEQGVPEEQPPGHHPERHHQGVPGAGHIRVPAGAVDAPDRRHDRLHGRARAEVEPDQHLLLPPAGGRRDAGAGDRLRDEQRDRGARRGPRARGRAGIGSDRAGLRAHLVLRQCGRALHRGARQAARDVDPVGGARARALRRERPPPPALPLRRAGQLAGPDRGPAREQRAADRARDARGHARPRRPRASDPAARLERGAGPAPPVGPAVVAAHPAGARIRDRHPRLSRHLRGLKGHGGARRGAAGGSSRRDGRRRRARRRGRGGSLHEGRAGRLPPRADPPDRVRRAGRRRPEPLHRVRGLAAHRRRGGRHPGRGSGAGSGADRGRAPLALRARPGCRRCGPGAARGGCPRRALLGEPDDRHDRRRARRRHHRRVGGRAARGVRQLSRPDRRRARRRPCRPITS